jgi:hypothetical protein
MKPIRSILILLCGAVLGTLIQSSQGQKSPLKTQWTSETIKYSVPCGNFVCTDTANLGLREDGVVVWGRIVTSDKIATPK